MSAWEGWGRQGRGRERCPAFWWAQRLVLQGWRVGAAPGGTRQAARSFCLG